MLAKKRFCSHKMLHQHRKGQIYKNLHTAPTAAPIVKKTFWILKSVILLRFYFFITSYFSVLKASTEYTSKRF